MEELIRFLNISDFMPALRYFFGFLLIVQLTGCNGLQKIQNEIDSISSDFVPDKRTGICSIRVKKGIEKSLILTGETTSRGAKDAIINALYNYDKKLIDSILILPDTSVTKRYLGLATLSVINLRKEPDHSSELVSQAILGTPVLILKDEGSWLMIQTPDNYISWTERSSMRRATRQEIDEWKLSDRMIFFPPSGWIYSNPSETGVTGDLVAGCILSRTGESDDHFKIILPDGREGFVHKQSLMTLKEFMEGYIVTGEHIVNNAASLLGVPYLWGGSSTKGMDCSGFVQVVFFMNRLILGRDASLQALQGDSVDISKGFGSLNKGDLLFFGSDNRISHVAIYKGDGEYIHASGRVMINSLDSTRSNFSSYRRNSLVKAKRILVSKDLSIVPISKHPWY